MSVTIDEIHKGGGVTLENYTSITDKLKRREVKYLSQNFIVLEI